MIYILIPTTKDRRPRLKELLASIEEHTQNVQHCVVIYENADGGWVKAIHNALQGINGYVVVLGSDTVVEKDWLWNLWNTFITAFPKGDGAAEPFNELHGEKLCQHPLAHTDTIRKYLHEGYIHNFSDNEFTERLRSEGKLIFVPSAKIQHNHVNNGKAPMDETYKIVLNTDNYEHDSKLFSKRKATNFT